MSSPPPSLRQRGTKKAASAIVTDEKLRAASDDLVKSKVDIDVVQPSQLSHRIWLVVVTVLAFVTRFKGITYPDSVVFDEVHFGK
ncbi:hypothetical protein KEM56_003574, partial [Ascosphaera pollenicola]